MVGMPISTAVMLVALLVFAIESTADGPKGDIVLGTTGLGGILRVVPLAVKGVVDVMIVGAG